MTVGPPPAARRRWRLGRAAACVALALAAWTPGAPGRAASAPGAAPAGSRAPTAEVAPASPREAGDTGSADLFRPARARALVVGASRYDSLGSLRYAGADARLFAEALVSETRFAPEDVQLLVDGEGVAAEDTPTLGRIKTRLADLLADPARGANDLFVFYFSGHGVSTEDGDYLLPPDVGENNARRDGLPVAELVRTLVDAGVRNVVLVLDACRDGARHPFGAQVLSLAREARLAVLLSTGPGQQSYEAASKGHGLFTYYLVRALRKSDAWDPVSGALWASRLGAAASDRVREYTAEDFDVPQQPQVHVPPGEDVLLAAKLPPALDVEAAQAFIAGLVVPGSQAYAASVTTYAQALYLNQRYGECAAVLETAEQLGALSPDLGYALVRSLFSLGRTGEGRRALERLRANHPDAYGTLAATVQDLSGVIPCGERVRAARRLLGEAEWLDELTVVSALLALKDCGTPEETAGVARDYIAKAPEGSTLVWVPVALLAAMEGRDEDVLATLEAAERALPASYERVLARHFLWSYLDDGTDDGRLLAHLERWIAEADGSGHWFARRARIRKRVGDHDGALADARAALALPNAPEDVLLAVEAVGIDALTLTDEVAQQARWNPTAWEVALARLFVEQAAPEGIEAAIDALDFASGRRVHLMARLSELELRANEDGVARGKVDPSFLRRYLWDLNERTLEGAERFEGDETAWRLLVSVATRLDRSLSAARAVRHHLGPALAAGELPTELARPVGVALMAVGDVADLDAVRRALPEGLPMRATGGWLEVALRGLRNAEGDAEAARALAATLPQPDQESRAVPSAWRALEAARAGDVERARAALAELDGTSNAIAVALAGAAHFALGEFGAARTCFELVLPERIAPAPFLRPLCLAYFDGPDLTAEERAELAFLASREGPGNPLYDRFAAVTDGAAFRGRWVYEVEVVEGPAAGQRGRLRLALGADGIVDGTLTLAGGDGATFEGTVDARGNLRARLDGAERTIDVFAKLAPPEVLKGNAVWQENGQYFLLLDEQGRASVWIARPAP